MGAIFVADARKIVDDYESAMGRIAHYREGVTSCVTIGFLLGSYGSFLPEVCRRYSVKHPGTEFEFKELEIGAVQRGLSQGTIDVGFTLFSEAGNSNRYEFRCLYRSTLTQTSVRLRNAGIDVRNDDRIVDAAALMATLVSSGRVAMALDHLSVYGNGNVVFVPIEGTGFDLCAGPMWKKSQGNGAVESFISFLAKETKGFSREDYLSRQGADTLPFE